MKEKTANSKKGDILNKNKEFELIKGLKADEWTEIIQNTERFGHRFDIISTGNFSNLTNWYLMILYANHVTPANIENFQKQFDDIHKQIDMESLGCYFIYCVIAKRIDSTVKEMIRGDLYFTKLELLDRHLPDTNKHIAGAIFLVDNTNKKIYGDISPVPFGAQKPLRKFTSLLNWLIKGYPIHYKKAGKAIDYNMVSKTTKIVVNVYIISIFTILAVFTAALFIWVFEMPIISIIVGVLYLIFIYKIYIEYK